MTSMNLLVSLIIADLMILMAAFPAMIETARKTSRETRMYTFGTFAGTERTTQLADFIEGSYSDNRVVFLKMMKGVMLAVVLSALVFFAFGYHVSANVIPKVVIMARNSGLSEGALGTLGASINEVPTLCLTLAYILVGLVMLTSTTIGILYEFPRILKNAINP